MNTPHNHDTTELFQRYLDVCNQALEFNKNRFPFKQILDVVRQDARAKIVDVCIIDTAPEPQFTITVNGRQITGNPHGEKRVCSCEGLWRVDKSYLKDVTQNPEEYIQNPALINWDWLYIPKE